MSENLKEINIIKEALIGDLKGYRDVLGAGIKKEQAGLYIVVYIKKLTSKLKSKIPKSYHGTTVKHEIVGKTYHQLTNGY